MKSPVDSSSARPVPSLRRRAGTALPAGSPQTVRDGPRRCRSGAKTAPSPEAQSRVGRMAASGSRVVTGRTMHARGFPLLLLAVTSLAARADQAAYGPELEGFDYAFPVQRFQFESQRQPVQMSYLDVRPAQANGRAVVLLHGKNFCAGTWE